MILKFSNKLIPLIELVFTHKWQNIKTFSHRIQWRKKELGFFYEKKLVVGKPKTGMAVNEVFSEKNFVQEHTLGISLIVCRFIIKLYSSKVFGQK